MTQKKFLIYATVYLKGDDLDPAQVSELLGVAPSESQCKGDKRLTSAGNEVVAKTGLWALGTVTRMDTLDLPSIVGELTNSVGAAGSSLGDIPNVEDAYLDLFVAIDADDEGGGTIEFGLSEHNISVLKTFGLPIRFTVAVVKASKR